MNDDPVRAWWSKRGPLTPGVDEPDEQAATRPDPVSLHPGALPLNYDQHTDPIRDLWEDIR